MVGLTERRKFNMLIASVLRMMNIGIKYPDQVDYFEWLTGEFPDQRAAQIFCNYVCPDYRNKEVSKETKELFEAIFPDRRDPFYEESEETLSRLIESMGEECLRKEWRLYHDLEEIKELGIPEDLKKDIVEMFGKKVFFDQAGDCTTGTLVGLRTKNDGIKYHYIIDIGPKEIYLPFKQSITLL